MPILLNRPPSYRRHRPSCQAVVTLGGRDHYLGPHDTKASRAEYDRVVGEWMAGGRPGHVASTDLTVAELVARFWTHAQAHYRHADGSPTSEISTYKLSLGLLTRLYGRTRAADFGPLALENVRNAMIEKKWARRSINIHTGRLKRLFKWGVAKELVPASVHHALTAVAGLRTGRSAARETDPVKPVPDATVDQTLPHLSPTIAAMIRLQLLTGARPGEICGLTTAQVDRSASVWTISPPRHKTTHHGHGRSIQVGPQARPCCCRSSTSPTRQRTASARPRRSVTGGNASTLPASPPAHTAHTATDRGRTASEGRRRRRGTITTSAAIVGRSRLRAAMPSQHQPR